LSGSGSEPFFIGVELTASGGSPTVQLRWLVRPPGVGDVPPVIDPCEIATGQPPTFDPFVTTTEPRSVFDDPGTHTVAVDVPYTTTLGGGLGGTLTSQARYAITFVRVNEDGSPYGG
jgi:hypothetical protein